ncbi:alpha/beta hydrolase [Pseudogracilibacillus sp. SE30717A]|uniref:alpha/beta hydrolase n=1 Tax=Pseudogracilibacillus sp. SE30717A TaxID=3098293 RepID=UPI00300E18E0
MSNLSPESKAYLEAFNEMPALETMEPQAVREMMAQAPPVEIELASVANVEDRLISVGDAEIKVRIYTPEGNGPFPLFVYYHGGGWVIGDLETADASCRMIANKTGSVVVSVDYRLSPEYKYPVPFNDSYEALKWVYDNAEELNGIASNIVVGGDSAGGNLSAAVSIKSRDENGPKISAQILIYPVTDMTYDTPSYNEFQKGFGLDKNLMVWFVDHYISNEADKKDKYAAPLVAKDLRDLPPAFVITAEYDVLRDEGNAYAERLKTSGVKVETFLEKGLIHGYFTNMAVFPEQIKRTISKIEQFLSENTEQVEKV